MKTLAPKTHGLPGGLKLAGFCVAVSAALLLQGCATPQTATYLGAADAQKRMEAENAPKPGESFDSLATYLKVVTQMQDNELWFASLAHIDALEQRWGVTPESNRLRANGLRNAGQPVESAMFYQRLKGTPLESAGLHGLGLLAGNRGDFAQAVQLLEQARQLRPADAALLGDLGYAQLRSGRIADARVPLMQAYQLKPDSKQGQVNLALYFEASGDLVRAASLMDSQHMSDATRAAIRNAARELNASLPPADVAAAPAPAPAVPSRPVAVTVPAARTVVAAATPAGPVSAAASPVPAAVVTTATTAATAAPADAGTDAQPLALTLKASPWSELSRAQTANTAPPVLSVSSLSSATSAPSAPAP